MMKATELLDNFKKAGKRVHIAGDLNAGVIVALDMEGRLFTVLNGNVLNRVNPAAILGESTRQQYLNPGGDGLWPAPEGTSLGYQYSTEGWRVSPGLRMARYQVIETTQHEVSVGCEIDLINSQGLGIPCFFTRKIKVTPGENSVLTEVIESITYLGTRALSDAECLIAPWTLCQFDCGPGCEVVFPASDRSSVWDLYDEPSDHQRQWDAGLCRTATDGSQRYQIALDERVPWIGFRDPGRGLYVRREADVLPPGHSYIDISDAPPNTQPSENGVRYSIYSDTDNFMEIEAVGGSPKVILPGTELSIRVVTEFTLT